MAQKIATCCYCGARAALRLDGARHELVCSNCGAPLHEMKSLKSGHEDVPRRGLVAPSPVRGTRPVARGVTGADALLGALGAEQGRRGKRGKPRKSLSRKIFSEVFDVIEDMFD